MIDTPLHEGISDQVRKAGKQEIREDVTIELVIFINKL
jgi:hypothetical protein